MAKLIIKNFQSHKNTIIEFGKGLTAIIGLNNHGKSSIIRAFRKLIRNKPLGNNFISNWANECSIELIDNNYSVLLNIKKNNLKYILKKGENSYEFVKFGREVPKEIINEIGISEIIDIGDKLIDFNFSNQFDSLFVLNESSLFKAKLLSKVSGIDKFYVAISNINDDIRKKKEEYIEKSKKLDIVIKKINIINKIPDYVYNFKYYRERLEKLNNIYDNLISLLTNYLNISRKYKLVYSISKKLNNNYEILLRKQFIIRYYTLYIKYNILNKFDFNIINLLNKKLIIINNINDIIYYLSKYKSYKLYEINFDDLFDFINRLKSIKSRIDIIKEIIELKEKLNKSYSEFINITNELNNLINSYEICPFCGRSIK